MNSTDHLRRLTSLGQLTLHINHSANCIARLETNKESSEPTFRETARETARETQWQIGAYEKSVTAQV
jgi:hypothetical protein